MNFIKQGLTINKMSYAVYLLQFIAFVDLFAVGLIIPLIPNHVRQMGANHIYVGLLGSIYAGFQLGSGPFIGSLSDIKGRRKILIVTLLLCGISYSYLGLTSSVFVILFLRAVLGLFKQTQLLTKALVPDYEKNEKRQSEIYGRMAAISSAGITLGPVLGGHIAEDYPEHGFIYIATIVGIFFAINAGLVYLLPKTNKTPEKDKKSSTANTSMMHIVLTSTKQSFVELSKVKWSKYWDVFMFKALVGFAMGVYYSNYALYLKTQFDLTPKYVGYVISFQGVIGSASCFFIGFINSFYTKDKDYSLRNFHTFILSSLSLLGLICSFNLYVYLVWLIPLAISNAVARLVTLEMVLKRSDGDHRGTLIGASNSVRSFAGVVAPLVTGFIGHYIGVRYVIYASLSSSLIGLVLSYYTRSKTIKVD